MNKQTPNRLDLDHTITRRKFLGTRRLAARYCSAEALLRLFDALLRPRAVLTLLKRVFLSFRMPWRSAN